MSDQPITATKYMVVEGEQIPVTQMVPSFVGRCLTCGFVALGHRSRRAADQEVQRHHQDEHPEEWPTHSNGTPCFHTSSDCREHGACMDCDACKLLCECL